MFLDIAEDGIILLDRDGMLRKVMEETRSYVRERRIERTEGGWRFPVTRGTPTYLSKVTNFDFARAMLDDAARDHRIGQLLFQGGFFDKAVYHFQQTAEKAVKFVLIALGVFRRTHLVGAVLRSICEEGRAPEEWRARLLGVADNSEELESDLSLSRYPAIVNDARWLPADEHLAEHARGAEIKSAQTLEVAEAFVRDCFSVRAPGT